MGTHGHQSAASSDVGTSALRYDYDPICGRLLVASARGGLVIFHGVPIDAYICLRDRLLPTRYLRDRPIGEFPFVCSSVCWPKS